MSARDTRPVLRIGHSPDPDDAFMWWPLAGRDGEGPAIDTGRFSFEPIAQDIETLNRRADRADLEITAMSCAQYPRVGDRYVITSCGASLGEGYGPKLVAARPMSVERLRRPEVVVAIPGERTSAFAAMRLRLGRPGPSHVTVPFDEVIDRVAAGACDAGLVIHEGQLTYEETGLHMVADLGRWWTEREGLPLPLGLNTVRRDLDRIHGPGTTGEITGVLLRSVRHALDHREASIDYAMGFAGGTSRELADRFIAMYVNRWTLDFGERGRAAVRRFLDAIHEDGFGPDPGPIDFVDPEGWTEGTSVRPVDA